MKLKRFIAPDMRQAMNLVREQLGPDAVIVSNKTTDEGVEIVAAVDEHVAAPARKKITAEAGGSKPAEKSRVSAFDAYESDSDDEPATYQRPAPRVRPAAPEKRTAPVRTATAPARSNRAAPPEREPPVRAQPGQARKPIPQALDERAVAKQDNQHTMSQVQAELQHLRSLIETRITSHSIADAVKAAPAKHQLVKSLLEMGFSPLLIKRVIAQIQGKDSEALLRQALAAIAKLLPVYQGDLLNSGGVLACVGPTGVGKTTTIAKLAANFVMRHGKNSLALVTVDNFRIGAHEHLKIYGRILGVPVRTAGSATELHEIMQENYDKRLIIVDTAGVGQRDARVDEITHYLRDGKAGMRSCLVLAANTNSAVIRETLQRFHVQHLAACILTKLDEAATLGGPISELIGHKVPIAFVTDGQRVPEDLHAADAAQLADYAKALWQQNGQWLEREAVDLMVGGLAAHVGER